jgi:hypothetical protein
VQSSGGTRFENNTYRFPVDLLDQSKPRRVASGG